MSAGGPAEPTRGKAAAALDKVTDAAATGVEKVADALDKVTGGLFEERLAETGGKVADTLRRAGTRERRWIRGCGAGSAGRPARRRTAVR